MIPSTLQKAITAAAKKHGLYILEIGQNGNGQIRLILDKKPKEGALGGAYRNKRKAK